MATLLKVIHRFSAILTKIPMAFLSFFFFLRNGEIGPYIQVELKVTKIGHQSCQRRKKDAGLSFPDFKS